MSSFLFHNPKGIRALAQWVQYRLEYPDVPIDVYATQVLNVTETSLRRAMAANNEAVIRVLFQSGVNGRLMMADYIKTLGKRGRRTSWNPSALPPPIEWTPEEYEAAKKLRSSSAFRFSLGGLKSRDHRRDVPQEIVKKETHVFNSPG